MDTRTPVTAASVVIVAAILMAIIVGAVAVLHLDIYGEGSSRTPPGPDTDPTTPDAIDPALIRYRQTGEIPVSMQPVRALAVGPEDRIYVAGDKQIHVFDPGGEKSAEVKLEIEPRCLAVGGPDHQSPGRIYVGGKDRIAVYDLDGAHQATWDSLGEGALLTSVGVAEQDVFAADMGNRIVLRYDTSGQLVGRIGARDAKRRIPGFMITTPYFDLAVAPDKLLSVVNPRRLCIETYTFDGDLELEWGEASSKVDGFFGCCNPAHFAILPDGRYVTAEKGISRVKIYNDAGEFECVVAGPAQLAVREDEVLADVAADSRGRILILDPRAGGVLIFEPKPSEKGAPDES